MTRTAARWNRTSRRHSSKSMKRGVRAACTGSAPRGKSGRMNPLVPGSDLPPGKGGRRRTGWMLAGLVLLGVGVSAWIVHQMDRDLREHLLVQTRMVAQSLDPEEIREAERERMRKKTGAR